MPTCWFHFSCRFHPCARRSRGRSMLVSNLLRAWSSDWGLTKSWHLVISCHGMFFSSLFRWNLCIGYTSLESLRIVFRSWSTLVSLSGGSESLEMMCDAGKKAWLCPKVLSFMSRRDSHTRSTKVKKEQNWPPQTIHQMCCLNYKWAFPSWCCLFELMLCSWGAGTIQGRN